MKINNKIWSLDILICQFFLSFEHLHKNPEQVEAKIVENSPNKKLNWFSNKKQIYLIIVSFLFQQEN